MCLRFYLVLFERVGYSIFLVQYRKVFSDQYNFLDLKKAFDTVNHTILLKKLEHYGFRGVPLQWFESYLSARKQFVSVNGHSSDELEIKHCIPQGSVLGLLLFLLYINDLPSISKKFTFYLFADDTNIYFESSNLLNTYKRL